MRRFAASTYEALQSRVSSLFDLDTFLLKYEDEEGDLVTVSSEWELEEALRCQGPVLRLNVEATDDRQSGDFILVERDCVVHVDQTADDKSPESFPSPLSTSANTTSQTSEATPMILTPLPQAVSPEVASVEAVSLQSPRQTSSTAMESSPESISPTLEPAVAVRAQDSASPPRESYVTQNGSKRSYAEACQSKVPYLQGTSKASTYIISVSNSSAGARAGVKPHAVSSTSTTPYIQAANGQKPYAKGQDGVEFTQTPKVSAPYASGKSRKSSPAYAQPLEDSRYASQSHAAKPFTQVK